MKYIIYDLEFNQDFISNKVSSLSSVNSCKFEIIQIGAVALDENLNMVNSFNSYIKPTIYNTLHPYVEKLTNIDLNDLLAAEAFSDVYKNFLDFIGEDDIVLCVWGKADIKEFFNNLKHYNLDLFGFPRNYIDIQKHTSNFFNYPKGKSIGLKTAIELFEIPISGSFHDAYNDALYTSYIFKKVFNDKIKPSEYEINKTYRPKKDEKKVNYDKLFLQFEKMLKREITLDEKNIIKVAYNMGKTSQFQEKIVDKSSKRN